MTSLGGSFAGISLLAGFVIAWMLSRRVRYVNRMAESIGKRQFELQESKNTLAAVIDASPVGIVCSDLERRIALWNPAAEKLYGYTAAEAIGTSVPNRAAGRTSSVLRNVSARAQRRDDGEDRRRGRQRRG
jgi:PAS domain-containing protein